MNFIVRAPPLGFRLRFCAFACTYTVYSKTLCGILEVFFCEIQKFFQLFLAEHERARQKPHGFGKLRGDSLQRAQTRRACKRAVARAARSHGGEHEQPHLPRAAHHAEREQREQRRRAVEHVQQRAHPRGARPAAQHPERVEQQSERRAERKRRQKLQHLLRDRQLHQPNSRAQKPSPRCCSSS
ncbi:MAG: hypothetical protein PUB80_04580 [Clostridiales bacterium]|nr:hypothetical protein [Clostridiales bacterium]